MRIFKSAFEKLSADNFSEISESTRRTADAVNPGGDLFEYVKIMSEQIVSMNAASATNAAQNAIVLGILGKQGISNLGKSFQVLIDALNSIEDTEDAGLKLKMLTEGIAGLLDIGGGLIKFSLQMAIAGPLLVILSPAIALSMGMVIGLLKAFSYFSNDIDLTAVGNGVDVLKDMSKGLITFGLNMVIAAPLLIMAIPGIIVATPLIIGMTKLFKWIDTQKISDSVETTSKAFVSIGLSLITIAGGLLAFRYLLPPDDPMTWMTIGLATVVLGGLAFLFKSLDSANIDKSAPKVAMAMVIMGGAIFAIGAAIALFGKMLPPTEDTVKTLGMVALTIGGVALVMSLAGTLKSYIISGAGAMIISSVAVIALGFGFQLFAKAVPPTADGWITIRQVSAALVAIGLVMGLAGAAAVFIIPGAAAMLLAGVAMIAISYGIKQMATVFSDNSIDSMLADSGQVTEGFLGFGGGRPMSKLEWLMLSIARSFALPPLALAGLVAGVAPMMAAGAAMVIVGKGIEKFQSLNIDYEVFPDQMRKVVFTLADVFGEIGTKYPGGRNSLLKRVFSGDGGSPVADGISSVMGMGSALTSIALGVQAMADLKFPIKYDKNGNPIEFTTLSSDYAIKLTTNVRSIVNSLSSVFGEIGNDPELGKGGRKGFLARVFGGGSQSPVADGISAVMGMGESLASIATGVQAMADLKFPIYDENGKITGYNSIGDINDIEARLISNTRKLVSSLSGVFGQIGKRPDAEDPWGWFGKSNIERGIGLVEQFGQPLSTLTEAAKTFGDQNFSEAKIKSRIQGLIGIFVGDTGIIGKDGYEAAGSMWYNIDSAFDTMGDEFENIADGINEMDLEKVKEARMMFEAISALSNSPKDDILREMGDSIESALSRLAELLEEFKGNVTEGNVASQQIGSAVNALAGMFKSTNNTNEPNSATVTVDVQPVVDEIDNLRNLLIIQGIKIKEA